MAEGYSAIISIFFPLFVLFPLEKNALLCELRNAMDVKLQRCVNAHGSQRGELCFAAFM